MMDVALFYSLAAVVVFTAIGWYFGFRAGRRSERNWTIRTIDRIQKERPDSVAYILPRPIPSS